MAAATAACAIGACATGAGLLGAATCCGREVVFEIELRLRTVLRGDFAGLGVVVLVALRVGFDRAFAFGTALATTTTTATATAATTASAGFARVGLRVLRVFGAFGDGLLRGVLRGVGDLCGARDGDGGFGSGRDVRRHRRHRHDRIRRGLRFCRLRGIGGGLLLAQALLLGVARQLLGTLLLGALLLFETLLFGLRFVARRLLLLLLLGLLLLLRLLLLRLLLRLRLALRLAGLLVAALLVATVVATLLLVATTAVARIAATVARIAAALFLRTCGGRGRCGDGFTATEQALEEAADAAARTRGHRRRCDGDGRRLRAWLLRAVLRARAPAAPDARW